nr:MAG TPA: hypothetical protein [Caudoviricetes sp.]
MGIAAPATAAPAKTKYGNLSGYLTCSAPCR